MVTCGLELKIYVDDMIGSVPVEFHSLVLADEFTFVPKDSPSIAQWIVDVKV
jgi:hypothetical protein